MTLSQTNQYVTVKDPFKRGFQIPKDWVYPKFAEVVKVNPQTKLNSKKVLYAPMDAINIEHGTIDYFEERNIDENLGLPRFTNNDVLFARITPSTENGKICIIENFKGEGIASSELIVLRPTYKVKPRFLYYFVQSDRIKKFAISQMMGTTGRQRVPDRVFKTDLNFELPPLVEQQRIVSILSIVDKLIQKIDQIIEQSQRLKKGLTDKLLTNGIKHTKFKSISLGAKFVTFKIPEEWNVQTLESVSKVIDVRHSTPKYTEKGLPLILPNNVKINGLDLKNTKFTSENDYLFMTGGGRRPAYGDIIYSRNATFGIACRVETDTRFSLGQDLVLIKPQKVNSYLLYLILNSRTIKLQLLRLVTGSTFQRINLDLIRNYLVIYPDTAEEQNSIAQALSNFESLIVSYVKELSYLNRLKKGLMQQLLTGKIRVKA